MRILRSTSFLLVIMLLAMAAPAAHAAPVKMKLVRSPTITVPANLDNTFNYANDHPSISQASCGTGLVPIAAGWKGRHAPVDGVGWYSDSARPNSTASGFQLAPARGLKAGSVQALAVCASSSVKARRVEAKQGAVAKCGSATALGYLRLQSVKQAAAVSLMPVGRTGSRQRADDQGYGKSAAVCVDKAAFTGVRSVMKSATFKVGSPRATVSAACPRTHRALSFGFSSPEMLDNAWKGDGAAIHAATVESAIPSTRAWKLTFATPDLEGAKQPTRVKVWAVCGKPRMK
jgi:hypothetical protein